MVFNPLGKSVKDIMNIPRGTFQMYGKVSQKILVSRLVSVANKRVRRLIKNNIPITLKSYVSGGKFSVRGKSGNELLKEYDRVMDFLSRKTSTVKGYRQFSMDFGRESVMMKGYEKKKEDERVYAGDYVGDDADVLLFGDDWQALDDMISDNKHLLETGVRYEAHDVVKEYLDRKNKTSIEKLSEEEKNELKDQLDEFLQHSGVKNATLRGNKEPSGNPG